MKLASEVLRGSRLALARLLTQVENDTQEGRQALSELFPYAGKAHLIGVTGAPGTGKSSLVNQLARHYRQPVNDAVPRTVGVIAVDPSSPFTGGAILGDRVRMRDLAGDPGVFIRSMASRGSLGGLAITTSGVAQALDAAGYEIIIIETVGAGQAEVEIAQLAQTTLVLETPGSGDDIQTIKAGILEIADILVINKADHQGVDSTERALRSMLQLAHLVRPIGDKLIWEPPIVRTIATDGTGLPELLTAIESHRMFLINSGEWERRERMRLQSELNQLLKELLVRRWRQSIKDDDYRIMLEQILSREISPWQAAEKLVDMANNL